MWEGIAGALVGAGAKLIPNLFGDGSDKKAEAQFNANFELQQRMAEHGTLIRARDVMRAYGETGIHPLTLLGANPASASTVASVGGGSSGNWRKGVADAGQDIGRAIAATGGEKERAALTNLAIERAQLENQVLKIRALSDMRQLAAPSVGPPMPGGERRVIEGQGDSPIVKVKPAEVTAQDRPGMEGGTTPDVRVVDTPGGGKVTVPAKITKESIEDVGPLGWQWWWRNHMLPIWNKERRQSMMPKEIPGKIWRWDGISGEWRLEERPMPSGEMRNVPPRGLMNSGYGSYRR